MLAEDRGVRSKVHATTVVGSDVAMANSMRLRIAAARRRSAAASPVQTLMTTSTRAGSMVTSPVSLTRPSPTFILVGRSRNSLGDWFRQEEGEGIMRVGYALARATATEERLVFDIELESQIQTLTHAGCARIHTDVLDGVKQQQTGKGLQDALAAVSSGDTLVVVRLDRIGRTRQQVLDIIALLAERGVNFHSVGEALEVTRSEGGSLWSNIKALASFPEKPAAVVPAWSSEEQGKHLRSRIVRRVVLGGIALVTVILLYLLSFQLLPSYARFTGRVVAAHVVTVNSNGTTAEVTVMVTSGTAAGRRYTLQETYPPGLASNEYQPGDNVLVGYEANSSSIFIDSLDRRGATFVLLLIFVGLITLVARRQGIMALIGMSVSLGIILGFVVPHILGGGNPLIYAVVAALVVIPATYYLAHGLHQKTTVAIVSTLVTLAMTVLLAAVFTHVLHVPILTGEDVTVYLTNSDAIIDAQSVYLAALLIGSLAVLNDITISQASIVASLQESNPELGFGELFRHAMAVGRDHVASLVNTLVLVYVGASFPSFLIYVRSIAIGSFSLSDPDVSAELLRTIVVSCGIVTAVPVSTAIAAYLATRGRSEVWAWPRGTQ